MKALLLAASELPIDKAQMEAAQDDMKTAQTDRDLADIQLHRIQTLARTAVVDQQSLDVATAHQRDAVTHLAAATATVTQAEATLVGAEPPGFVLAIGPLVVCQPLT